MQQVLCRRRSTALAMACSCLGLTGCSIPEAQEGNEEEPRVTTSHIEQHCFRNKYPFPDDPENWDIEELFVEIEGGGARGRYSWLPAFKDQRVGDLLGGVEADVVQATYTFAQEGGITAARITITLGEDVATVRGGLPALGLNASIQRIDCSHLTR